MKPVKSIAVSDKIMDILLTEVKGGQETIKGKRRTDHAGYYPWYIKALNKYHMERLIIFTKGLISPVDRKRGMLRSVIGDNLHLAFDTYLAKHVHLRIQTLLQCPNVLR